MRHFRSEGTVGAWKEGTKDALGMYQVNNRRERKADQGW